MTTEPTIHDSINAYLEHIDQDRRPNTARQYQYVMKRFVASLQEHGVDPDSVRASFASETWAADFFRGLGNLAPSTQAVHRACVFGWYRYLSAEELAIVSIQKLQILVRPYLKKPVKRVPQTPSLFDITRVVNYAVALADTQTSSQLVRLRLLRDRAFILTLADTGIEVQTACSLRRGDLDWRNSRFVLAGEEWDDVYVSFSPRVADALRDYLNARTSIDSNSDLPHRSLPLFAHHRGRERGRLLPFSYSNARKIVVRRAREALGAEYDGTITPISFRHYFVASAVKPFALLHPKIVRKCQALFDGGLYDDAIFNAMKLVEEEVRLATSLAPEDIGRQLIARAMSPGAPLITFSTVKAEQESALLLFSGAIGSFKNPLSHRFLETSDPVKAFECLALASLLMRMLDEAT